MVANYSLKNNFRNKAYNVQYILDSSEIFIYYFDSCQLIYAYKLHFHLHGKKEICRHLQTVQKKQYLMVIWNSRILLQWYGEIMLRLQVLVATAKCIK